MDTLRILFLNKYPRRSLSFHAPSGLALISVHPVYLRVTYTGKAALTLERNLRIAVENCYGSVALRTVFVFRQMLPASRKDVLPAIQNSSVIYEYKCHCDSRYVGRTRPHQAARSEMVTTAHSFPAGAT